MKSRTPSGVLELKEKLYARSAHTAEKKSRVLRKILATSFSSSVLSRFNSKIGEGNTRSPRTQLQWEQKPNASAEQRSCSSWKRRMREVTSSSHIGSITYIAEPTNWDRGNLRFGAVVWHRCICRRSMHGCIQSRTKKVELRCMTTPGTHMEDYYRKCIVAGRCSRHDEPYFPFQAKLTAGVIVFICRGRQRRQGSL